MNQLTPELLRTLLRYDPKTGKLFWRPRLFDMFQTKRAFSNWNNRFAEKAAFTARNTGGYFVGTIFGRSYLAHRVIWAITNGAWPKDQIDHISGARDDNNFSNLREASGSENQRNAKLRKDNTSGHVGVHWCNTTRKWRAKINVSGDTKVLGQFADKATAIATRLAAEVEFGYHVNHGRMEAA